MHSSGLALLAAVLPLALSAPERPPFANTTILPMRFGAVIFPHFQALDLYGPLDILNSLAMVYGNQTNGMTLSIFAKTMDPVSTAMTPGGFGESTLPTMTFDDYLASREVKGGQDSADPEVSADCDDGQGGHAISKRDMRFGTREMNHVNIPSMSTTNPGDIDVLIVPGGGGARRNMTAEIAFVRKVFPKVQYIFSVCTGASILARAGVLDNLRATTNKRSWAWVVSTSPKVNWIPTARWVKDGNVWTTSGIAAGQDGMFAFVSHVYGDKVAQYMADSLEYIRQTDEHNDPFGKLWDVPGAT